MQTDVASSASKSRCGSRRRNKEEEMDISPSPVQLSSSTSSCQVPPRALWVNLGLDWSCLLAIAERDCTRLDRASDIQATRSVRL